MANFMSLPTEIRLQIYRELFIPKPRTVRMGLFFKGPVMLYNSRTFHTRILEASKKIHGEAIAVLYGETAFSLQIYLIFRGTKMHGSNIEDALHSLARSKQFSYLHTCIVDVRLFRGEPKENNTTFSGVESLRANVKLVRRTLLRARSLIWRDYYNVDLTEPRCRSLEPLDQLPITYKLSISKVDNTVEALDRDLMFWPDTLKANRVMLFGRGYGENDCIQWTVPKWYGRWRLRRAARV